MLWSFDVTRFDVEIRSEIYLLHWQRYCRCACQVSQRSDDFKPESHVLEFWEIWCKASCGLDEQKSWWSTQCFMQWLVAHSSPSQFLHKCWLVHWTQWNKRLNRDTITVCQGNKTSSARCLRWWCIYLWVVRLCAWKCRHVGYTKCPHCKYCFVLFGNRNILYCWQAGSLQEVSPHSVYINALPNFFTRPAMNIAVNEIDI